MQEHNIIDPDESGIYKKHQTSQIIKKVDRLILFWKRTNQLIKQRRIVKFMR